MQKDGVRFASPGRAADALGLCRTTIYELLARGHLQAVKVGRRTLVDMELAVAWMRAQPRAEIRMAGVERVS